MEILCDWFAAYWYDICSCTEAYPSVFISLQVVLTGLMNFASAPLAVTAVVLYSVDIAANQDGSYCDYYYRRHRNHYDYYNNDYNNDHTPSTTTPSPDFDICKKYFRSSKVLHFHCWSFCPLVRTRNFHMLTWKYLVCTRNVWSSLCRLNKKATKLLAKILDWSTLESLLPYICWKFQKNATNIILYYYLRGKWRY